MTPLYNGTGQQVNNFGQPVSAPPPGTSSTPSSYPSSSTGAAGALIPGETANLKSQQNFAGLLLPEQQAAIQHLMALIQNPQGLSDEYRDYAMSQVQQHLPELYAHLQSTGAGIGAQQGATLAANNQGASQANAFQTSLMSPSGIEQRGQAVNQLASSASPNYGGLGTLGQVQHPQEQPDNTLGQFGGIIGGLGAAGLKI